MCTTDLVWDPVKAPDIRFSSSHFHKQHPHQEKAVTQTLLFPGLTPTIFNLPPCLTCTNTLTPIKSVTDQLINEKDSSDMEQLDLKTTSLWFTESDIHSIPNLVESIKKYHSNDECGFDIILRREEMIRHAKWHRKREE
ncbi:unnamed protein product, partial [Schistosoma curassoni]|uniref:NET domain-containing protein n=1 Tax=Schistosoma curassoni TaxID=6186 RepID=A0A183KSV2_9TREM